MFKCDLENKTVQPSWGSHLISLCLKLTHMETSINHTIFVPLVFICLANLGCKCFLSSDCLLLVVTKAAYTHAGSSNEA